MHYPKPGTFFIFLPNSNFFTRNKFFRLKGAWKERIWPWKKSWATFNKKCVPLRARSSSCMQLQLNSCWPVSRSSSCIQLQLNSCWSASRSSSYIQVQLNSSWLVSRSISCIQLQLNSCWPVSSSNSCIQLLLISSLEAQHVTRPWVATTDTEQGLNVEQFVCYLDWQLDG